MIIRSPSALPSPEEAARALKEGKTIHLVGPRREALLALGLGPLLSLLFSSLALSGMLVWKSPEDPLFPVLGPLLGFLISLAWALYAGRLLQKPEVESGIHLSREGLMTFALQRKTPHHQIPWERCGSFGLREEDARLLVGLRGKETKVERIDWDYEMEGGVPLNVPTTFVARAPKLLSFLEGVAREMAG